MENTDGLEEDPILLLCPSDRVIAAGIRDRMNWKKCAVVIASTGLQGLGCTEVLTGKLLASGLDYGSLAHTHIHHAHSSYYLQRRCYSPQMLFADLDGIRRGSVYHALKGWRMSSPLPDDLWKAWVALSLMTFVCLALVICYHEISSDVSSNFDRMILGVATGDGGAVRDGCYHDH